MKPSGHHDQREEILEWAWNFAETGTPTLKSLLRRIGEDGGAATLAWLNREGLLRDDNGAIRLTSQGKKEARHVVRANRLAARLLTDLFDFEGDIVERHACRLEHAINPELADSLCTLLGHPPSDPNGRSIPPGKCCREGRTEAAPALRSLATLALGQTGRVVFIHFQDGSQVQPLAAFGLVPGTPVRLKQKQPAMVIEVGETTLALDETIAKGVFVKPL